ncbi:MAG: type II secretion system protein [Geobacter sp.]|nr:type II secretion system protein [Geobacter sp.]
MIHFVRSQKGLTLIELIVTVTILAVLASLALPLSQMTTRRMKEIELRRNLRTIRTAIDEFKKTYDKGVEERRIIPSTNVSGYPEILEKLVEGHDFGGAIPYKKKFLRRIPPDPFHPPQSGEKPEWGLRSYTDDAESSTWGGEDVYDVYSLSEETAIDGSKYKEW